MKRALLIGALSLMMMAVAGCGDKAQAPAAPTNEKSTKVAVAPVVMEDQLATIKTNQGTFTIRLYGSKTPITVQNFVELSKKGFYNNVTFHRVIDGFMIQGGDPQGDGRGGPGYTIPDEFVKDLHFDKAGLLAMANRGPNTGGSQFFITLAPTPWLDNKHTIFGAVVKGLDVVEKIGKVQTDGKNDRPVQPVIIESVTIEALAKS